MLAHSKAPMKARVIAAIKRTALLLTLTVAGVVRDHPGGIYREGAVERWTRYSLTNKLTNATAYVLG
jgi:hypothetical protein